MKEDAEIDSGYRIPYNSDRQSRLSSDNEDMNIYSDVNVDLMDTPQKNKLMQNKEVKKSKSIENAYSRGNRKLLSNNADISQNKFKNLIDITKTKEYFDENEKVEVMFSTNRQTSPDDEVAKIIAEA